MEGARLAEEGAHVDDQKVDAGRLVPVRDNEPPDAVCRPLPPREELVRPVLGHDEGAHLARRAHRARRGARARVELVDALLGERHGRLGVSRRGAPLVRGRDVGVVALLVSLVDSQAQSESCSGL